MLEAGENTRAGKIWGMPETVAMSYTPKDKPSLLSPTDVNLGDMSSLQKWLVAFAVALHNTGHRDRRSRKLAGVEVRPAPLACRSATKYELGLSLRRLVFTPALQTACWFSHGQP